MQLGWTTPLVLLALLLLPLIRRLHRRREGGAEHTVAALFLWPEEHGESGARKRSADTDPRWWLRAAIAALLILGLAGPGIERPVPRQIAVYFDDTPSMAAQEATGPRLLEAARVVASALVQARSAGDTEVWLHSLAHPQRRLQLEGSSADELAEAIEGWAELAPRRVRLPALRDLPVDSEHWLVTDGADPELLAWSQEAALDRVFFVGTASENVGVTRLATRPLIEAKRGFAGIVQVFSAGRDAAQRRLRVFLPERELLNEELVLAPGEHWQGSFELPADARGPLRAELSPSDAMLGDDALELSEIVSAPRPAFLDPRCGPHLIAAIRVHPGLRVVSGPDAFLTVWCGSEPPPPAATALWFRPDTPNSKVRIQRSARLVEIHRDMEDSSWVQEPGYVAFISEQLDRLAGQPLLERGRAIALGEGDGSAMIRIAPVRPGTLPASDVRRTSGARSAEARDLSGVMAALAMLLLLVDMRGIAQRKLQA
jgi:hypothetical protein